MSDTHTDISDFEISVLKMLAGRGPALPWGAALGSALGFLKGSGLAAIELNTYRVTDRGLRLLDQLRAKEQS